MAVIQYTAIVGQIRGKLNGSVFNKSKNAFTLQRKQQPPRGASRAQSLRRQEFSHAQRTWKSLSQAIRDTWAVVAELNPARDRFGQQTTLSGYNQFIKAFTFARVAGLTAPPAPEAVSAPTVDIEGLVLNEFQLYETPQGFVTCVVDIDWVGEIDLTGFGVYGYVSLPLGAGVDTYYGRYVLVGGSVGESESRGTAFHSEDMGRYPVPVPGQRFIVDMRIVHLATGQVVYSKKDIGIPV